MFLEAFINNVQDELEDPGGFATFPDAVVARAAESACRYLGNNVGRNVTRIGVDMIQDQADYPVPTVNKIRRINQVKIIPENGNEPPKQGLIQVDLLNIPLTIAVQSGRDSDRFVLDLTGGTAENQYTLTLWPTPGRSAIGAIVIDAEVDIVFDVANQATENVPYPEQFEAALRYLTAFYLLAAKDDQRDQNQALNFKRLADQEIAMNRPVDALTKTVSSRRFP